MIEITRGVYEHLVADAQLMELLALGPNGQVGVYVEDPPTGSPAFPFILAAGSISDSPADTKTTYRRDVLRDVLCVDRREKGTSAVETIAEHVRRIFHERRISIPGAGVVLCEVVSGPIKADGPGTHGRLISVRLLLEEN